jgi:hypothetical protein
MQFSMCSARKSQPRNNARLWLLADQNLSEKTTLEQALINSGHLVLKGALQRFAYFRTARFSAAARRNYNQSPRTRQGFSKNFFSSCFIKLHETRRKKLYSKEQKDSV